MAKKSATAENNRPDNTPAAGEGPGPGKPRVYNYRCREACTFMKRYWGEGEIAVLSEKTDNRHFELVEQQREET
jgi:hypothetical protein